MIFKPSKEILYHDRTLRLGVVGKPSDWLIASNVDYKDVLETMNLELVDVPIEEMTSLGEVDPGMAGAEAVYQRLKENRMYCAFQTERRRYSCCLRR